MSNLDEAFTQPLQNMTGTHKQLSGNPRQDFPRIIAEMINFICTHSQEDQLTERYAHRLQEGDLDQYRAVAYDRNEELRSSFLQAVAHRLSQYHLQIGDLPEPIQSYLDGPADYFQVWNEYRVWVIGIGPYGNPVWLQTDEAPKI